MHFSIWIEQIEGKGEDAPPTLTFGDNGSGVMAVYDGLGGAGSKAYQLPLEGENVRSYSGAYLASRLAKRLIEAFYQENYQQAFPIDTLAPFIQEEFRTYSQEIGDKPSKLRSKLIRTLPTTLAGIYFEPQDAHQILTRSFWAGDSRCYVLQKNGLRQISQDDLKGKPDALTNLLQDAIISNCVSAQDQFQIHEQSLVIQEPSILITATDGCFGYLPSPAHFEYLLLDTLMASYYDEEHWQENLSREMMRYAGDDISMSLLALGFDNLNELKNKFYDRHKEVFGQYIQPLAELEASFEPSAQAETANQSEAFQKKRKQLLQDLWDSYKNNYYIE